MPHRLQIALVTVIAVCGLCACGARHEARPYGYTVSQVVAAFDRQGIAFHPSGGTCTQSFVCLTDRRGISAYLFVGDGSSQLLYTKGISDRESDLGNLTVIWPPKDRENVLAALRSLRH